MPFAPFTGVNHHRQSTLFGCALLSDEREETFVWLFRQWLNCMWDESPGAIITDQDLAICNATKKSSQRSESMNSFFNGYVNSNTPLSDFVDQYEKPIASRRDTEENEDLISMTTTPDLTNMHSLEAHAGKVYSRSIFKLFQNEFMQILHCQHSKKVVTGVEMVYAVTFKYSLQTHTIYHEAKIKIKDIFCRDGP
ncbi:hypothetical protein DCAR_0933984 [Daucus carota subsp. sativus]|uniref:Protein FAR1-RELATED SEQUENCE n=1 Tax=Daucus carota subsp. sativus TaxID=79200 RepID=A0AAF1BCM6_DAUCS|nr:hypothetical protein DCAR_0933984 [Daucus carota subsp. sativus]